MALPCRRTRAPPPAFTYGFAREFNKIRFVRLDGRQQTGEETLELAQSFLAAGFPFVLGFPVSNAVGRDAEIPFPTVFDSVRTGMAAVAVGYDDSLRIHSDKGALLIRTSWGDRLGRPGLRLAALCLHPRTHRRRFVDPAEAILAAIGRVLSSDGGNKNGKGSGR